MIRNSIVAKLWLTIVGMVILVLMLLSFLLQQFFNNYVYQQQSRQLMRLATEVQTLVSQNNLALAERIGQQLANVQQAHVDISIPYTLNTNLKAAYDNMSASDKQTLLTGEPVSIRGVSNGSDTVSVYLLVPSSGVPGLVDVSQQMSVLDQPLAMIRNLILFATGLGVVLTTGLAFVVSKNLSRPLVQMNRVAEAMARGNFDWRINVVTRDEVGRLGNTFNELTGELKMSIEALSMEKDQLSSILSSLQDGVVAADLEGNISLANPPAIRRFRSLILAETGIPESDRLPDSLLPQLDTVVETKQSDVREYSWQGRHIVVTMTPLYESGGEKLRGVVIVTRDVSEERRLDRLRKDFIANVSHELRTPLAMLQGYTEALQDEFGDDPEQRKELTEIIHDETLRMRRLVNDLLDIAQLESGQFQMAFSRVDMSQLVWRVGRKFNTLASDHGVTLTLDLPEEAVWVSADADGMEQVFTNLVDNAIRHTGTGGEVHLSLSQSTNHAQVRIRDTGSGIPEEDLPYIWERFYKADKARTRGKGGTGLGLAITRHIVQEHGGHIIVESQVGEGTIFTVSIPLLRQIDGTEQSGNYE